VITFDNVGMHYGEKVLFEDVNLALKQKNKYGLVGANGAGKSTLLRLILGEEETSKGSVSIPKDLTIGSLKQDQFRYENDNIIDVVLQGRPKLWETLQEREMLFSKSEFTNEDGYRIVELEEYISENGGYEAEGHAEVILKGLGIDEQHFREPLSILSGGQKIRILLAQSLFGNPDILLLDEPNNHLDLLSIEWLQNYLIKKFNGILVLISHDHDFLNDICSHILDVDYQDVTTYVGNYDHFVAEKQLRLEQMIASNTTVEKKKEKLQQFVTRFKATASKAKQAQSKMKMIAKLETEDMKNTSRIAPNFAFTQEKPTGKEAFRLEEFSISFDEKKLFQNVSLNVLRGEKIAILGKNGIGKSSLLKSMLGIIKPDSGETSWGHNAKYSYFSQDHHDLVTGDYTCLEWLSSASGSSDIAVVRGMLGRMLFVKDDAKKKLDALSGGEAARLLFASIMLKKANIMILDEPTNHLDLESRISLAKAVKKFEGAVLFVSHDRNFISKIANRIIFLHEKGFVDFHGPYREFVGKYSKFFSNEV
jgi:ATPase subunit of ABC transporter with duplicated ATPase domains